MNFETLILSFNHPELTERTILSGQQHMDDEKIHLVHNGSLPQHVATLKAKFPNIRHLEIAENQGFTGGTNFGLAQVFQNSNWCFFLTNDCVLEQISTVQKIPGLYAPLIYRRNSNRVDSFGGFFNPQHLKIWHNSDETSEGQFLGARFYVPGTAFLMHRNVFDQVGTFETALHTYWEDVDFSLRAREKGFPVSTVEGFRIRHGVGKTCHKHSLYTNFYFQRNRYRISRKYGASKLKILSEASRRVLTQIRKNDWEKAKQSLRAYIES